MAYLEISLTGAASVPDQDPELAQQTRGVAPVLF